jgi:hypothetical protein
MPARKSAATKASKSGAASKRTTGALPPYGVPIREALARGDQKEMQQVAASARKYINDVQSALDKLDSALNKKS